MNQRLRRLLALAIAGAAVAAALAIAAPLSRWSHERRWRSLPLAGLIDQQKEGATDPVFLYYLGRRLNEQGRFSEAAPVLQQAAGYEPNSSRVREAWTQSLLGSGQLSQAFGQLKQFVGANPNLAEAHYLLGSYHLTQQSWPLAQQSLEKAVALKPNYGQALSLLANACLQQQFIDQGRGYLERSLKERPYAALDHLQLAILETSRNADHAESEFAEAAKLRPGHAETYRAWANFTLGRGNAPKAVSLAKKALELAPAEAQNHYVLGRALLQSGDESAAQPELEKAAELAPLNPLPAQELRLIASRKKDTAAEARWKQEYERRQTYQTTRRKIESQLKVTPKNRKLRQELAGLIAQTGNIEATVQEWARALRQRPDQPTVLAEAARSLVQGGHPLLAIPLARQAIQTAPNNIIAYEALGDAYLAKDWIHEAAVAYQSATNGAPRQREIYKQRLALAAAKRQKNPPKAWQHVLAARNATSLEQTISELKNALDDNSEQIESLRMLLELSYRQGQPEVALDYAKRLLALLPDDSTANLFTALIFLREPLTEGRAAQLNLLLDKAEASGGATSTLLYARGLFALQQQRPTDAKTYLLKSAQLDSHATAVFKHLVEAAKQLGDAKLERDARKQLDLLTQRKP